MLPTPEQLWLTGPDGRYTAELRVVAVDGRGAEMTVFEFPASAAQRRMWLLDHLDPGQPTYHVGAAVWLDGPLDTAALGGAWAAVVARHEVLRTTFRANGGRPVQVIHDDADVPALEVVALDHLPEADREAAARIAVREHAASRCRWSVPRWSGSGCCASVRSGTPWHWWRIT